MSSNNAPTGAMSSPFTQGAGEAMSAAMNMTPFEDEELKTLGPEFSKIGAWVSGDNTHFVIDVKGIKIRISKHIPKNVGKSKMEAILVELKTKPE